MLKVIKYNSIEIILVSQTQKEIVKKIVFNLQNFKSKNSFKINKFTKLKTLEILLSERESEIALMLIKRLTIITISHKLNLAITTISTFKGRIFDKFNNLIQLAW
jgi:DNA-binding CsgD family transcriptional regulator